MNITQLSGQYNVEIKNQRISVSVFVIIYINKELSYKYIVLNLCKTIHLEVPKDHNLLAVDNNRDKRKYWHRAYINEYGKWSNLKVNVYDGLSRSHV